MKSNPETALLFFDTSKVSFFLLLIKNLYI
jgi:hypothetical protein